jgi:citrate lyase subunit beta/citryl-CoA lyase
MMFVPGNQPGLLNDASLYGADVLIFDLEDSVALTEKDAARTLLAYALPKLDWGQAELMVRVNDLDGPFGLEDLEAVIKAGAKIIRLPKADNAEQVKNYDQIIGKIEAELNLPINSIEMLAAIESAQGVLNAKEIAAASPRLMGLALGAEDFTADLGVSRSKSGEELLLARQMIVLAAKAQGIDAYDTVYSQIDDLEGLAEETKRAKALGFRGKSVLHPNQIEVVHQVFAPSQEEIAQAQRLLAAVEEAKVRGSGVISLDGAMVDRPVILRAERIIHMAKSLNILKGEA